MLRACLGWSLYCQYLCLRPFITCAAAVLRVTHGNPVLWVTHGKPVLWVTHGKPLLP